MTSYEFSSDEYITGATGHRLAIKGTLSYAPRTFAQTVDVVTDDGCFDNVSGDLSPLSTTNPEILGPLNGRPRPESPSTLHAQLKAHHDILYASEFCLDNGDPISKPNRGAL